MHSSAPQFLPFFCCFVLVCPKPVVGSGFPTMHQICCSAKLSHLRFQSSIALSFLVRSSMSSSDPAAACCRANRVWGAGRAALHLAPAPKPKCASQVAVLAEESRALHQPSAGKDNDAAHVPVLLKEVLARFEGRWLNSFVDCTLGAGGHASAIIAAHPEMRIFLGMDVDPVAHKEAYPRLQRAATSFSGTNSELNIVVKRTNFTDVKSVVRELDPVLATGGVDGILMDLGMSSMQVNEADRGFSFMRDGPADMRMDPTATLNAEVILNTWPEGELGRILRDYGEERRWKYLARRIVEERLTGGISTTSQLVAIIGGSSFAGTKGKHGRLKPAMHPATRTFQALRIAVNDELKSLELALFDAFSCLSPGGRLQVISFHSLEDRIIKHFFLKAAGLQKSRQDSDEAEEYTHVPGETRHTNYVRKKSQEMQSGETTRTKNVLEGRDAVILTKRPIVPSNEEVNCNPRSRSSKLRVIEKK